MIEISVYLNLNDYAKKVCKLRERVDIVDIDIPLTDMYRTFRYLWPKCVIELVMA